jgi:hypothetical protein
VAWSRLAEPGFRLWAKVQGTALVVGGLAALTAGARAARVRFPDLGAGSWLLVSLIAAAAFLSGGLLLRGRRGPALAALAAGVGAIVLAGSLLLVPEINRRSGLRAFGSELSRLVAEDAPLVVDQEGYEQILFYSHRRGTRRNYDRTSIRLEEGWIVMEVRRGGRAETGQTTGRSAIEPPGKGSAIDTPGGRTSPDEMSGNPISGTSGDRSPGADSDGRTRRLQIDRFLPGVRVFFVAKERHASSLLTALGPSSRTLLTAPIAGDPYVVIASR